MSITTLGESGDLGAALRIFTATGHNGAIGLTSTGRGHNWIEYRMPWREDLVESRESRIIDASVIFSILDSACAMTTWAKLGHFAAYPTLDMRVDFLRPPLPGADLVARGECYAITPDFAFMRGIAHEGDPDHPVASCCGTFMSFKERAK